MIGQQSLSRLNPDLLRGRPPRRQPDLDLVHIVCLVVLGATVVAMLLLRQKAPLRPLAAPNECRTMARGGGRRRKPQRTAKKARAAKDMVVGRLVVGRLVVAEGRRGLRDLAEGKTAALADAERRVLGWKEACEVAREEGRDLARKLELAQTQAQEAGVALVRQVRTAEAARDATLKDCREECATLRRERDEARAQLATWRNRAIGEHQQRWEMEPLGVRPGGVEPPGEWLEGYAWFLWPLNNVDLNPVTLPGRFLCDWSRDCRIGVLVLTDKPQLQALDGYGAEPFAPLAESVLYQDGQRTVFAVSAGQRVTDGEQTAQKWAYLAVGR